MKGHASEAELNDRIDGGLALRRRPDLAQERAVPASVRAVTSAGGDVMRS